MFIRSLAGSFHGNAMNASTSLMVPVEHLTRIQGVNQMLNGGLNVVSAPLGALLLSVLPLEGILIVDVATALAAILPLLWIQIPQPARVKQGEEKRERQATIWQDFRAGLQYLVGWPGLVIIGLMTVGINLTIIPAFSLLPLMVKSYFGGNAMHLGWVESAMGLGIIVGGGALSVWGGFERRILTSLVGLMGMGVGTLLLALAPPSAMLLAVAAAAVVGATSSLTMGPFFAVIQATVEPDMQARVLTLMSSVGSAMVPVGLIIAGPVADRFGIQSWFFLGGVLCVLMSIGGLFIPAVMNIEERGSVGIQLSDSSL
jgi:DHA3 family macrolide efflux protein-like MFS transporter